VALHLVDGHGRVLILIAAVLFIGSIRHGLLRSGLAWGFGVVLLLAALLRPRHYASDIKQASSQICLNPPGLDRHLVILNVAAIKYEIEYDLTQNRPVYPIGANHPNFKAIRPTGRGDGFFAE